MDARGEGADPPMADVVAAESSGNGKYGNAVTLRVSHQRIYGVRLV